MLEHRDDKGGVHRTGPPLLFLVKVHNRLGVEAPNPATITGGKRDGHEAALRTRNPGRGLTIFFKAANTSQRSLSDIVVSRTRAREPVSREDAAPMPNVLAKGMRCKKKEELSMPSSKLELVKAAEQ